MRSFRFLVAGLVLSLSLSYLPVTGQQQAGPSAEATTGWICGVVTDESQGFIEGVEARLFASASAAEPIALAVSDAHGVFCFQDVPPGFYDLRVSKERWPPQASRQVEARAGLLNRLLPIELELEPGEPRVSFDDSFDGMPLSQARSVMHRLLDQGDANSIREAARRLLPKRGVRIEVGRIVLGRDPKPLCDELMRQVESSYLPPLKTARYIYAVGELVDPRTNDNVMRFLLSKLRDGRRLPSSPGSAVDAERPVYVSDIAMEVYSRLQNHDFKWKYGQPPAQNQSSISAARTWWEQELARRKK
ncbi:MAG TPA: carboxypeptidase-like regulatory domain-containing protein [Candidatus Xenobia bacterium]|nr:carboxypeptidase-like regulatory domain-containing protein [Candidatus Xenobia bacterium]